MKKTHKVPCEVAENIVKDYLEGNVSTNDLAKKYKLNQSTVTRIVRGIYKAKCIDPAKFGFNSLTDLYEHIYTISKTNREYKHLFKKKKNEARV
jgi:predicted transcriptional regulator